MIRGLLVLLAALCTATPALASEWIPGPGERSAETRTGPDFTGMRFLFPLRLHLSRGGFLEGQIAGADELGGELLLVTSPGFQLRVDYDLVTAVTPLAPLPPAGTAAASARPPGLASVEVVYRRKPTWRSGLGLVLNLIAPGTGHFIQKDEKALGLLFLGMDLFFLAAGSLAAFAPSRLGNTERAYFSVVFFSFDALTRGIGAAHAFNVGRERRPVPAGPGPGLMD